MLILISVRTQRLLQQAFRAAPTDDRLRQQGILFIERASHCPSKRRNSVNWLRAGSVRNGKTYKHFHFSLFEVFLYFMLKIIVLHSIT